MTTATLLHPEALLRRAGLKVTHVRLWVLSLLADSPLPLTHADVMERLPERGGDRVTIYRTLRAFEEKGLVVRIEGAGGARRFAVRHGSHLDGQEHAHFFCDTCGEMKCLEEVKPPPQGRLPRGFRLRRMEVVLHGLCPNCSETS